MNIKNIAKRIPDNVRSEILLTDENIIDNAVSSKDNPKMKILLRVWFEFIEPDKEDNDCPICIGNILTNYRQMKGALIELENEYQKLKNL